MSPPLEIKLWVAGRSRPKQRARFDPRTNRAYTPPANVVDENDIRAVWREAGEPRLPDDSAVFVALTIKVVRPQGHYKKDGTLSAEGTRHPVPRNKKPDVDNALKLVMDALNTRAYRDDVQVAGGLLLRQWSETPGTEVLLRSFERAEVQVELWPNDLNAKLLVVETQ